MNVVVLFHSFVGPTVYLLNHFRRCNFFKNDFKRSGKNKKLGVKRQIFSSLIYLFFPKNHLFSIIHQRIEPLKTCWTYITSEEKKLQMRGRGNNLSRKYIKQCTPLKHLLRSVVRSSPSPGGQLLEGFMNNTNHRNSVDCHAHHRCNKMTQVFCVLLNKEH